MNKNVTKLLTIATAALLLAGCDLKKDEKAQEEKSVTTIEEIQKQNGKPARVIKAAQTKLTDVRKFSGTIEGMQQTYAISKMNDPLAKINVRVGSSVKKDQVLAEYVRSADNTQLEQTQEQIALLEKATERMREVYQKGGISQQDMDSQELQLKIAKMNLETLERANKILAPSSGVVTEMKFQVGQVPGQGPFCTIAKLDQVILKLNITSQDIGLFKKGAQATVSVNGEKLKGKVTTIPLAANPQTRFFPVEVTFNNKGKKLLPGMYITADMDMQQVSGVVVPVEAIVYRNGLNTVWTVDAEGNAKRKIVQVGVQSNGEIMITEGIQDGETVIVEGQSKMNDGDKVLIVE
ncbi:MULTISPECIES: efflux RND transporter periplasmic adaptor subunit [unclassified Fibrobacter]|uniref:efflux RND transporter periplasmic adaptor subunit n=1 Tax=unclassified Fibrobacter TaxID=2634177 RepID=UPI000D6D27D7|nr:MULTISPECIES: efflux RND transporter periplasmic adaptor subunit [unclassified Fibrobacter]PWJ71718.1 RND family efflux transporter MFP subunit [Fibrobacter sp. UWR4]PZW74057.1 RND family efflux transporter MFP subunit [Fibrobacter sp. UWR1]